MADLSFTQGAGPVLIVNDQSGNQLAIDANGQPTVNQGTPGSVGNAWPSKMTDGTNVASVDTDGSQFVKPVPVGTNANAWNAASVSSGGNSNVIDLQYCRTVSIFGNVSGNVNPMRIQASQDNVNFFTITTISATTGNFGATLDWGARYLRLQSGQGGAAVTITATVAGK